ncbi:MAG: hypothetical protein LBQ98_02515 [Nitrososphaerota archaeon]|nr:hypothetical protein [Nitrososphaerota archaeon]
MNINKPLLKFLSTILFISMIISLSPSIIRAEETKTPTPIPENANHITTANQLAEIGGEKSTGQYYILDNDITLDNEWIPINDFRGILNGQNHTINNLYVLENINVQYAGLFGQITVNDVVIKNLGININSKGVTAACGAGGLIGNCSNITVENCYVTGNITAFTKSQNINKIYAGGLIGNGGNVIVNNSYATVDITTTTTGDTFVGGLIGNCRNATIKSCYATGDITTTTTRTTTGDAFVGGLIGNSERGINIANCYTTGNIVTAANSGRIIPSVTLSTTNKTRATDLNSSFAGGLIGSCSNNLGVIENCYVTGDITATVESVKFTYAGDLIGSNIGVVKNCYSLSEQTISSNSISKLCNPLTPEQMKTQQSFVNWDFKTIWAINPNINKGYPHLRGLTTNENLNTTLLEPSEGINPDEQNTEETNPDEQNTEETNPNEQNTEETNPNEPPNPYNNPIVFTVITLVSIGAITTVVLFIITVTQPSLLKLKPAQKKNTPTDKNNKDDTQTTYANVQCEGPTLIFDKTANNLNLPHLLKIAFPEDYTKILTCAYYLLSENKPLSHIESWSTQHTHPHNTPLTNQHISYLLKTLPKENQLPFFTHWIRKHATAKNILTTIIKIPTSNKPTQYHPYEQNQETKKPPQINLCLLLEEKNNRPIYYEIITKDIKNSNPLENVLKIMNWTNTKYYHTVMGQEFYNEQTIDHLYEQNIWFTLEVPLTEKWTHELITKIGEDIEKISIYHQFENQSFFATTDTTPWKDQPCYRHIYYNNKKTETTHKKIEKNHMTEKNLSDHNKYFIIENEPNRQHARVYSDIDLEFKQNNAEITILLSNNIADPVQAYKAYRTKVTTEKGFTNLENPTDTNRLHIDNTNAIEGRLFIQFITQILSSAVHKTMTTSKLSERYTLSELVNELEAIHKVNLEGQKKNILTKQSKIQKEIFVAFDINKTPNKPHKNRYYIQKIIKLIKQIKP